jgi:hypothetical protein
MSDDQKTIKDRSPQFKLPLWSVLLIIAASSIGAAIGVGGTAEMKANFFIYFNAVALPLVAIVFVRSWLRRRKNATGRGKGGGNQEQIGC